MKRFHLLQLQCGANTSIAECIAETKQVALELLQPSCPLLMDKDGYAVHGEIIDPWHITYVVTEEFSS